MPRGLSITEAHLSNISKCLTITVNTLNVLVDTLKISALEAILNTTQSLLELVQTVKQNKDDCAELMEHTHQFLNAIISVYIRTLHQIHTFVEAQQSGSKVKKFFRQGELNTLLKDCKAGLRNGLDFFQFKMTADVMANTTTLHDQAEVRHQEVLNIIEGMTSSDSASSINSIYSGSYTRGFSSTSISMLPAEPKIFHGRDLELAEILKLFSQGTPRIAILGAGGMGKTSLARAALHHQELIAKYQGNQFFITCDTASNKVELAGLIGAHLGMKPGKDLGQAVLRHFSNAPPTLLILDNLETVWEPVKSRKEIEEFLSLLTDITTLALLVTMRGAERPAKVQWTQPFLMPLQPLAQDAARNMFIDIADDGHSMKDVDQVLHLAGNMPLAISLLAHLVDMEGCTQILLRWETEKTALISEGYDKRSNLELSISLSLSSARVTAMPHSQDLLALLSILPDGLSDVELKQSKLPIKDVFGCKTALLRTALAYTDDHNRLKVLVPVREYMNRHFPPTDQMIRPLLTHFHELLELYVSAYGKESGALPTARITSNYTNIHNVLRYGLQLDHSDIIKSIYCTCDFNQFSRRTEHGATLLLEDIPGLLPSLADRRLKTYFIIELFYSFVFRPISHPEMLITQALDDLKHLAEPALETRFHNALAWYYSQHTHGMPKAVEHCQISLLLARANGDYKAQCSTLGVLSRIEWLGGNYTAAQAYAREEQRLAKLSGNLIQEAMGLYHEQYCEQVLGNYAACIHLCTMARTVFGLCGMPHRELHYGLLNCQAEVHQLKSEYAEGHLILNQNLQGALADQSLYAYGLLLVNIADIDVSMGSPADEIQRKIDTSKTIFEQQGRRREGIFAACYQAALNLREGDMSSLLFCKCLRSAWGNFSDVVSYCLERLGDISCWERSQHPSCWTTVFLAHSSKGKQRLEIQKALQFLGDVFLKENDEATAVSLFTVALEGFTKMDVHRSRAECMIRLGDISKKNGDFLKALELWEMARSLFERSSQVKQVHGIDERLGKISEEVKEQHRINLARLTELNAPVGKVEEVEDNLPEDGFERENAGLVATT
ncbi:hypothetical protein B0H16DRAFT_1468701 [Mycena metata]|uniref:Novel STAND NTPase 1 domain-containing protein n=1 Tax=Mycena metata TaxID=1033252 RepID=A0AAD7MT65_9AGAR|nr:hypothetical protein B0H16DRAFT_1468701 [Mycena metata]